MKLLVPMVFVYSPAMLIVLEDYFTWTEFIHTVVSCGLGILLLSASVAGYFLVRMNGISRVIFAFSGLLLVAPSGVSDIYALVLVSPIIAWQVYSNSKKKAD